MKSPIMLTSTHDQVVDNFVEILKNKNDMLAETRKELNSTKTTVDTLENRNCKLNTERAVLEIRIDKLNTEAIENEAMIADQDEKIMKLGKTNMNLEHENEGLKKQIEEYKNANNVMSRAYNNMNRKLWCNDESKRQLRNLAADILESTKINKADLARYLEEIAMRVGGGEPYKFVLDDEKSKGDDENEKA